MIRHGFSGWWPSRNLQQIALLPVCSMCGHHVVFDADPVVMVLEVIVRYKWFQSSRTCINRVSSSNRAFSNHDLHDLKPCDFYSTITDTETFCVFVCEGVASDLCFHPSWNISRQAEWLWITWDSAWGAWINIAWHMPPAGARMPWSIYGRAMARVLRPMDNGHASMPQGVHMGATFVIFAIHRSSPWRFGLVIITG